VTQIQYPDDAFGIKWFHSKQGAKDHYGPLYGPEAFLFKLGNKMFAAMAGRQALIDLCLRLYQQAGFLPPFYKLVQGVNLRLYLDIEIEYEKQQEPAVMSGVITQVLHIVRSKLADLTSLLVEDARLQHMIDTANHRWKTREVDDREMWNFWPTSSSR
jgi:hypothetical protein